jgi:hypothetical protein
MIISTARQGGSSNSGSPKRSCSTAWTGQSGLGGSPDRRRRKQPSRRDEFPSARMTAQRLRPAPQRSMIKHREAKSEQSDDGTDQALGLPRRQAKQHAMPVVRAMAIARLEPNSTAGLPAGLAGSAASPSPPHH